MVLRSGSTINRLTPFLFRKPRTKCAMPNISPPCPGRRHPDKPNLWRSPHKLLHARNRLMPLGDCHCPRPCSSTFESGENLDQHIRHIHYPLARGAPNHQDLSKLCCTPLGSRILVLIVNWLNLVRVYFIRASTRLSTHCDKKRTLCLTNLLRQNGSAILRIAEGTEV